MYAIYFSLGVLTGILVGFYLVHCGAFTVKKRKK